MTRFIIASVALVAGLTEMFLRDLNVISTSHLIATWVAFTCLILALANFSLGLLALSDMKDKQAAKD